MTAGRAKLEWKGTVLAIQPRIRLTRSFDQRSHTYLGYVLRIRGTLDGEEREFVVAIGKAAQAKHGFRCDDHVEGKGLPVIDPRTETAEIYKVSGLKLIARGPEPSCAPPPYLGVPPPLETYRQRGHRRLAARTFRAKCSTCLWGCEMVVEIIVDHWNPSRKRYRRETFCYGPKSCALHRAGPTRKVPGRQGMSWEEEDWVDDEATAHRRPDE